MPYGKPLLSMHDKAGFREFRDLIGGRAQIDDLGLLQS